MKPIKCDNCKMFFDGDKYENCPHCKAATAADSEANASAVEREPSVKKPSRKLTEKRPTTEKTVTENRSEDGSQKKDKPFKSLFFHKKAKAQEEVVSVEEVPETPAKPEPDDEKTISKKPKEVSKKIPEESVTVAKEEYYDGETEEVRRPAEPEEEEVEEEPATVPSIADAVQRADSTSNSADEKTVAFYNFSNSIEPVVGWIICVEGEYMGESFALKSGRNNIGRSLAMDIALAKEKSVSRERHASITYEPNKMKFYIQSGESSGLTYVNDELIMMFTELNDYDVIALGASKFIFLRLCGEKFSWEDYS